jgi:hypothetical protein
MTKGPKLAALSFTLLLGVCGLLLLVFITRHGIGTSPDSAAYIAAARGLASGTADSAVDLVFRAPFYPVLLAIISQIGLDALAAARWLNVLLFALNAMMVGAFLLRFSSGPAWLPAAGTLLFLVGGPLLAIHSYAWTESLFIFLSFLSLFLLAEYLHNSGKKRFLLLSAVLAGLAWLTRYAGAPVVATGVVGLLLFDSRPVRRRIAPAVLYGAIGTLPFLLWIGRNVLVTQSATGRELVFHPIGKSHFWQAVFTVSGWLHVPDATPGLLRIAGLMLVVAGLGMVVFLIRRRMTGQIPATHQNMPAFFKLVMLNVALYSLFLIFSISFLDANTPLDDRILSPVYVAILLLVFHLLDNLLAVAGDKRAIEFLVGIGVLGFFALSVPSAWKWIVTSHEQGLGFSNLSWRQSAILQEVSKLPAGTLIFSNSPEAVYLVTGRSASQLPRRVEATTQQQNPDYTSELAVFRDRLEQNEGVVVYFREIGQRATVTEAEMIDDLFFQVLTESADGVIFIGSSNR